MPAFTGSGGGLPNPLGADPLRLDVDLPPPEYKPPLDADSITLDAHPLPQDPDPLPWIQTLLDADLPMQTPSPGYVTCNACWEENPLPL